MKDKILNNGTELMGVSKKEIVTRLGNGFNFYPDNQWSYILKKYGYGRKKILYIGFNGEGTVIHQYIESKYGKI